MLKKSNHFKRLIQPLPHFAAFVSRSLNFDIEMSIPKKYHLNTKGTVPKMKLTAEGGKEEEKALKEKIEESIPNGWNTLELKKGYVQIKAKK